MELLKKLRNLNILDLVELIDVSKHPLQALSECIVSVPTIFIDGELLDFGPIDVNDVANKIISYLDSKKILFEQREIPDLESVVKRLRKIVYDNLFLACNVYLREELMWLLDSPRITQLLNLDNKKKEALLEHLELKQRDYYERMEEKLLKVLRYNLELELRVVFGEQKVKEKIEKMDTEYIMHWLMARSSVARIGLIDPLRVNLKKKAEKLLRFLKSS